MTDTGNIAAFIVLSFSMALILIMKRNSIEPSFRRVLALVTLAMVGYSFYLVVYSFYNMGR